MRMRTHYIRARMPPCYVCQTRAALYCCPRCGLLYCSLACYRDPLHAQCSEAFYKESLLEATSSSSIDAPLNPTAMLDTLKRYQENSSDSDDDDPGDELADRLDGIDLDDTERVWEALTHDERNDFAALTEADIASLLPPWTPWWSRSGAPPPSPLTFPPVPTHRPAGCVRYNLVNALSSYVYVARFYNGDHLDMCTEAVACLLRLSTNLKSGANFEDVPSAVKSIVHQSQNNPTTAVTPAAENIIRDDLKCIFEGTEQSESLYLLTSVSDMYTLLNKYKRSMKNRAKDLNGGDFNKKFFDKSEPEEFASSIEIDRIMKKIKYYFLYLVDFHSEIRSEILSELQALE